MAAPDQAPESIIVAKLLGLRNTVAPERFALGELERAVNIDIDNEGQGRRRRGYTKRADGRFHSAWADSSQAFVVRDNELCSVSVSFAITPLGFQVDDNPLAYESVGDVVYFSSLSKSGKIVNGQVLPWGIPDAAGEWISPVITPTPTLGPVAGRRLVAPPNATILCYYKGRIYMACGRTLWVTEMYLYDKVDSTRGFIQFEEEITVVTAVNDGIYVGTCNRLSYLQGVFSSGMKRFDLMQCRVIPGSVVQAPASMVHPSADTGQPIAESVSPMFLTDRGLCIGLDGGQVFNLTQTRMIFPDALSAAALYREDSGVSTYTVVTDSAGGPAANARVGDYVDAQIVRAAQRS